MSQRQLYQLSDPAAGAVGDPLHNTIDLIRYGKGFAAPLLTAESNPACIVFGKLPGLPPFFVILAGKGPVPAIIHSLRSAGAIVIDSTVIDRLSD